MAVEEFSPEEKSEKRVDSLRKFFEKGCGYGKQEDQGNQPGRI